MTRTPSVRRTHRVRNILAALTAVLLALGSASCAGRKKNDSAALLDPVARYERARRLLADRELRPAIEEFGRVDLFSAENRETLEPQVRLGMADATFFQLNDLSLIDARALYLDFVTLYGDHPRAPYAQFQAGICSLRQVNHPSRDQSQTLQAIEDLREVERRYPASYYASMAAVMRSEAESSLAEHEFLVGKFYLKRKSHVAAIERFRGILDRYPTFGETDKVYYYLGRSLLAANNDSEAKVYLSRVVADFPRSEYLAPSRRLLESRGGSMSLGLEATP